METLSREEAKLLVLANRGFIREVEHAETGVTDFEDLAKHDPVNKKYEYGQEDQAAEDMAWVLFDVWELPIDIPLAVHAGSFHSEHTWEDGDIIR